MSLLVVHFDRIAENFAVVNTFDGVVVSRFLTQADAEDFARRHQDVEEQRVAQEYNDPWVDRG